MTIAGQQKSISTKSEFIKTIDALFLKMELAYHYQFYKVFGTDEKLREGKKLWALSLKNIHPDTIIQAVENVISSQSYLPTLTDLLKACKNVNEDNGLPSVEEAYMEAKKSYSPRRKYSWSHPIVYFAGKSLGWNILNERDTSETFKSFRSIYFNLVKKVLNGEELKIKNSQQIKDNRKIFNQSLFKKLRNKHKV